MGLSGALEYGINAPDHEAILFECNDCNDRFTFLFFPFRNYLRRHSLDAQRECECERVVDVEW